VGVLEPLADCDDTDCDYCDCDPYACMVDYGDGDMDGDIDGDVDTDADVDANADVDGDADVDADVDGDVDAAPNCDDVNCADGVGVVGQPTFRDCCCEGVCCMCDYGDPPPEGCCP